MERGVRIREAEASDAEAIARVRVQSWQSTYRGLLPEEYLQSLSVDDHARNWRSILSARGLQGFTYVAESEDGTVTGFALGGAERTGDARYTGELYAIYLLQAQQRQGVGKRLIAAVARRLLEEGMASMLVWVLAENPSRWFYEAMGGEYLYEKPIYIAGGEYVEAAYGWPDIGELTALDGDASGS